MSGVVSRAALSATFTIAEVVFAEVSSGVALLLERRRDGWISWLETEVRSGHAHLGQSQCH
jgi:hypothetical protein